MLVLLPVTLTQELRTYFLVPGVCVYVCVHACRFLGIFHTDDHAICKRWQFYLFLSTFFFFFGCAGSSLRYVGFFSCSTQASSPHSMWALSFRTRDRTCVPYMARWILNHWTTREVPVSSFLIWMYYYYLGTPTSKCLKGPGCGHCGERGPMSITGGCRHWLCKPPSSDC